jgi:hypothetical protein
VRKLIIRVSVVSGDHAGCEPIVAAQLFRRLQVEGLISREVIVWFAKSVSGFIAPKNNEEGIVLPNPKHGKKVDRSKVKQQRAVRQKYVFVKASKRGQRHRDYFNPNSAVQLRVMGMEDTVVRALPQPTEQRPLFVHLVVGRLKAALRAPPESYLTLCMCISESCVKIYRSNPTGGFVARGGKQCSHGA